MDDIRELRALSREECFDLLANSCLGRVVLSARAMPTALPVNFALDGDSIVFRSSQGMKLEAAQAGTVVAFEVDDFDPELRMGWSVLVTGMAHVVTNPSDLRRATALDIPTWVEPGPSGGYVRVEAGLVSGRRLVPVPRGGTGPGLAAAGRTPE
jgi:uncharacterized protein